MWCTYVNAINTDGEIIELDILRGGFSAGKYLYIFGYSVWVAFCVNAYYDTNWNIQILMYGEDRFRN